MRRGLYLLFEGLPETVVDSQVLVHASDMRRCGVVDFEIWSVAASPALYRRSLTRIQQASQRSESIVRLFRGVRPSYPASALINARLLESRLRRCALEFDLVHARTDYSAAVCSYLKRFRAFELVWDCRGDSASEFRERYSGGNPLHWALRGYFSNACRRRARSARRACDRAIFVSSTLRDRVGQGVDDESCAIIPCSASESLFFFDPELRAKTRDALGYKSHDRVLIYSGGMSRYQCYPESVALFRHLYQRHRDVRLLVITPDPSAALAELDGLPSASYQVCSARIEEVNAYLNASDYALMIRHRTPLNAAASPTKFAEYGMTGLPVIMGDSVRDAFQTARDAGNLCEYKKGGVNLIEGVDRRTISGYYRDRMSRSAVREKYRGVYAYALTR